ncbi:hypothetical protein [Streptomyces platensis]|uniref:hypothetical protein n=1 Tax=Streptomyces platensis TaxID=58346 RepID=UPI00331AD8EA
MSNKGEAPVGVTLIGEGTAPGVVRTVTSGRVAVDTGDRIEVYDQQAFLGGARSALYAVCLPPKTKATLAPDGSIIMAEGAAIRAVDADGSLDSDHVLVTGKLNPQGRTPETCHWLLQAATLQPLGRLHYPAPVGMDVIPLGDGTWLTRHDGQLRHWALA